MPSSLDLVIHPFTDIQANSNLLQRRSPPPSKTTFTSSHQPIPSLLSNHPSYATPQTTHTPALNHHHARLPIRRPTRPFPPREPIPRLAHSALQTNIESAVRFSSPFPRPVLIYKSISPPTPQDTHPAIFSSSPAPLIGLPTPPQKPHVLDPHLAAQGKPLDRAQSRRAAQSRRVASTPATGSASRVSTALVRTTRTASEVVRENTLCTKRREVEDLEMQMEILAAKLEKAKRGVREMVTGGYEERVVPLVVQVEMQKERYRGFKRTWEKMSDDDRFWYYVDSEESKIVD
jgi:hypothetical protein